MSESEPNEGDVFDIDRIRRLIHLMEEHDLGEIDLRQGEQQIRLSRGGPKVTAAGVNVSSPVSASPAVSAAPSSPAPGSAPEDEANIAYIKSPMVGTFYIKPNPESEAYVRVGDHVDPETTVCIIEAMKVFNEIPAELSGRIVAVLVENEEPVEFGKPLFRVNTSK
jgi:acetyl-CoA carboxylase biotin carboxyl carrier protein